MRDLIHNLKVVHMLDTGKLTGDAESSTCDVLGFDSAIVLVNVGADADTLSTSDFWELLLLESDDDSSYTGVGSGDQFVSVSGTAGSFAKIADEATEDSQTYSTGYHGSKRYLKVKIKATGTHTLGCQFAVNGILGDSRVLPVA
jgi:hypothetical protein